MSRLAFLALLLAAPAAAQQTDRHDDPGRAFMEAAAMATDADGDGIIRPDEIGALADMAFDKADADGDGALTRGEAMAMPSDMSDLADYRDRTQGYEVAMSMLYALFDGDGDGAVSRDEHRGALQRAAAFADADGDGGMSRAEFLDRFVVSVAMRAALTGR